MKNKTITYITNPLRIKRLEEKTYAKEFLYYFQEFDESDWKTNLIELEDLIKKNPLNLILYFVEKIFIKSVKIPFYGHKLNLKENFKTIKKSNFLILTNETMAYSILAPLLITPKKNFPKTVLFVMGLFDIENSNNFIKKYFLKIFLSRLDKFIFLSKNEYKFAKENFSEYSSKFDYLDFAIDYTFWNVENSKKDMSLPILFNGNDQNRNYKLMKKIINEMKKEQFIIISNNIDEEFNNAKIYSTSLRDDKLSDSELKEIYNSTCISLIPLKETIQPSGQSVALQSICSNNLVLITPTKGFWNYEKFVNKDHLIFVEGGLNEWVATINDVKSKKINSQKIIENSKRLVLREYSIESKFKYFLKILDSI